MPEKFNELLLKPDIIELYNDGITPNYGYLLNGRLEKDMVRTLYPLPTSNGNPITWEANKTEYLFSNVSLQPKQAGSGDPSPNNVRPISGYDSVSVNVRGKNLVDYTKAQPRNNSQTVEIIPNGVKWSGDFYFKIPITGLPKGSTIVFSCTTELNTNWCVHYADNSLSYQAQNGKPLPLDQNKTTKELYIYTRPPEQPVTDAIITNIQLEFGSTPTPYESYQPGTTATLTLPETIYGGTVDAVSGVGSSEYIFKELAIADMNNSEDFPGWQYQDWINECINNPQQDGSFLNLGIYGTISIADISKGQFWKSNSYNTQIYSPKSEWGGMTQSQIKAAYPDLVVQFCLKLVTPKSFQATGNQQLTSLLGYNTIYTDGDSMVLSRKARRLEV